MSDLIPGTAASLLIHGTITSHTNLTGDGEPHLHPAVREFFDGLPPALRVSFVGYCAESALVSDELFGLDRQRGDDRTVTLDEAASHFAGAALVARKIRPHGDPEHGTEADVCRSCAALLDRLGISILHDQT
ncbi:YwqJ-related putative deaminase [Streptomyces sp. NBC_00572]|uniref:YwqJ-related putative deaminase n=1 Tax=Streptomyces sp. NBC_00572 TaxID=2903664 RepID=UPI00224F8BE7|nr:YwqJ-related putative deaminase [Streptomyces sp. NBC_00572]MCX4984180.1 YwqJ-related putative deaminase [Streptomyces sp. NBC_00572]